MIRVVRIGAVAAGTLWLTLAASGMSYAQSHHRPDDLFYAPFHADIDGDTDVHIGSVVKCPPGAHLCLNGAYNAGNNKDTGNAYLFGNPNDSGNTTIETGNSHSNNESHGPETNSGNILQLLGHGNSQGT